jgi:hypothetical protein
MLLAGLAGRIVRSLLPFTLGDVSDRIDDDMSRPDCEDDAMSDFSAAGEIQLPQLDWKA